MSATQRPARSGEAPGLGAADVACAPGAALNAELEAATVPAADPGGDDEVTGEHAPSRGARNSSVASGRSIDRYYGAVVSRANGCDTASSV